MPPKKKNPKSAPPKSESNPKRDALPKGADADAIRAAAASDYRAGIALPVSWKGLDAETGRRTIGLVSPVYWRLEGAASPVEGKSRKARANALARRRRAGTRFEVLAASLAAALAAPVSVEDVKDELRFAGLDPETSYAGRGTRKSAAGEAARVSESAA